MAKLGTDQLTPHGLAAYACWKLNRKKKRTGRPGSREAKGFDLVEAAVATFHKYDQSGAVGTNEPASLKQLAKLAGVRKATVSKFLAAKFKKPGYEHYKQACARRHIGCEIAKWRGEMPQDFLERVVEEEIKRRSQDN